MQELAEETLGNDPPGSGGSHSNQPGPLHKSQYNTTEGLPAFGAQSLEIRGLLQHLAPWLRDGSLRLFTVRRPALLADRFHLRVMAGRGRAWIVSDGDLPLFAGVLAGDVAELLLTERHPTTEIEAWLGGWQPLDAGPLLARAEFRFHA